MHASSPCTVLIHLCRSDCWMMHRSLRFMSAIKEWVSIQTILGSFSTLSRDCIQKMSSPGLESDWL